MKKSTSKLLPASLAAVLAGFSMSAAADAVDINLNNDAALLRYLAWDGRAGNFGKREMDVGVLYTTEHDYMGMFGAQVIAEAGAAVPELEAGVGLKVFGTRFESENIFALALGGQLKYSVPPNRRIILGAEGYYSPDVVTSSPADNFSYFSAFLGYEVLPEATAYIGYRSIRADLRGAGKTTIDSGGHFGIRFGF